MILSVAPCNVFAVYQRFRGTYCLNHQDWKSQCSLKSSWTKFSFVSQLLIIVEVKLLVWLNSMPCRHIGGAEARMTHSTPRHSMEQTTSAVSLQIHVSQMQLLIWDRLTQRSSLAQALLLLPWKFRFLALSCNCWRIPRWFYAVIRTESI
jgi:hypothetical protein